MNKIYQIFTRGLANKRINIQRTIIGLAILNMLNYGTFVLANSSKESVSDMAKLSIEVFDKALNYTNETRADGHGSHFHSGSTIIPHPQKAYKGGEDAIVVRDTMIGVGDGVGGWASSGVDVAKYSKQLMSNIGILFDSNPKMTPKELMIQANKNTTHIGSSTCVIAKLIPENKTIATALLGDSSYMILKFHKNNTIEKVYRSEEQQYEFNFPYQIGTSKIFFKKCCK